MIDHFPAHKYEVDGPLVAGLRALYEATGHLQKIPLAKMPNEADQDTVKSAVRELEQIKDRLYLVRQGKPRPEGEADVPPVDLLTGSNINRLTPITKRLIELLADGEWHDATRVATELSKLVTPGEAYRYMERGRVRQGGPEERHREIDDIDLVSRGQRSVAIKAISSLKRIERDPPTRLEPGQRRRIRLRPMIPSRMPGTPFSPVREVD